jgi:hypothetical protein
MLRKRAKLWCYARKFNVDKICTKVINPLKNNNENDGDNDDYDNNNNDNNNNL